MKKAKRYTDDRSLLNNEAMNRDGNRIWRVLFHRIRALYYSMFPECCDLDPELIDSDKCMLRGCCEAVEPWLFDIYPKFHSSHLNSDRIYQCLIRAMDSNTMNPLYWTLNDLVEASTMPDRAYVAIMRTERNYAGPEEGGWYVTDYRLMLDRQMWMFNTYEEASAYADNLNDLLRACDKRAGIEYFHQGRYFANTFHGCMPHDIRASRQYC